MAHHEVFPPKDWEIRYEQAKKYTKGGYPDIFDGIWYPEISEIKVDPIELWVERWINELGTVK